MKKLNSFARVVFVSIFALTTVVHPSVFQIAQAQSGTGQYDSQGSVAQLILAAAELQKNKKYALAYTLLQEAIRNLQSQPTVDLSVAYPPVLDPRTGQTLDSVTSLNQLPAYMQNNATLVAQMNAVKEQFNKAAAETARQTVIGNIKSAQYALLQAAPAGQIDLSKLPVLQQAQATPEYNNASPLNVSTVNVTAAQLPAYRDALYNLSRSLTFRDTRVVRAQRAIDPTGYGGLMSGLYNNGGGMGTLTGFQAGGIAEFIIGSNIFGVDYDRQSIEYQRRYENATVDELADKLIRRVLIYQYPLGFITDLLGKLGPQNSRIVESLGGTPQTPTNPNTPGGMGGYALPNADGSWGGSNFGNVTIPNPQNSTALQTLLQNGRAIVTNPTARYVGDSIVAFMLYTVLMLQLAALYDVRITNVDLQVLIPIMLGVAQWRVLYYPRIGAAAPGAFKKIVHSTVSFAKTLSRKPKNKTDLAQQEKEIKKFMVEQSQTGLMQVLINTTATSNKILKLSPEQANQLFLKKFAYPKDVPAVLNQSAALSKYSITQTVREAVFGKTNVKPSGGAGTGNTQIPGQTFPPGGSTYPPGQPYPPGGGYPPPGQGQSPGQGSGQGQTPTPIPDTPLTFKQVLSGLALASFYGTLRYVEGTIVTSTMKAYLKAAYEDNRRQANMNFQRMLMGREGMPFLKLLAMAVQTSVATRIEDGKSRPLGPQPLIYGDYKLPEKPTMSQVFTRNQLLFIRNVARSAKRCPVYSESQKQQLEKLLNQSKQEDNELSKKIAPLNKCVVVNMDPEAFKKASRPSIFEAIKNGVQQAFRRSPPQPVSYNRSNKCSETEFKRFEELLPKLQLARANIAEYAITLTQCAGSQSNEEYNALKAEFLTFNGIRLGEDEIAAIQNLSFETRLRMGELIIQIQMLKGMSPSDQDRDFFVNIVLPAIALNNDIAKNYYSQYESFIRGNQGLVPYPWTPTGFTIKLKPELNVYDWEAGFSPPYSPSSKVTDYTLNDRGFYIPPGYGGLNGGYGGYGGGYGGFGQTIGGGGLIY